MSGVGDNPMKSTMTGSLELAMPERWTRTAGATNQPEGGLLYQYQRPKGTPLLVDGGFVHHFYYGRRPATQQWRTVPAQSRENTLTTSQANGIKITKIGSLLLKNRVETVPEEL